MKKKISIHKQNKLVILFLYEIILGLVLFTLSVNVTAPLYIFLSWTVPSIYFLYALPNYRVKWIISALLWSIPGSLILDAIGHYTKVWDYWNNPLFAPSGIQILNIPIESFYWGFSFWLFTVLIYEFFFDKHRGHKFRTTEKTLLFGLTLVGLLTMYVLQNKLVGVFEHFFIAVIIIYSIFNLIFLYKLPRLRMRFLLASLLAFALGMIIELFSLLFNLWDFKGEHYIASFNILNKSLPLEEIIAWFVLSMSVVIIHEVFVDTKD